MEENLVMYCPKCDSILINPVECLCGWKKPCNTYNTETGECLDED